MRFSFPSRRAAHDKPEAGTTIGRRSVLQRTATAASIALGLALLSPVSASATVDSPVPGNAGVAAEGSVSVDTGASADSRTTVGFSITGYRCSVDVVRERTLRNGTTIINAIESGLTESSIGLMTGALTLRSTTIVTEDGSGSTYGRWILEPSASTGSIAGSYSGPVSADGTAEIRSVGRGRRSLSGIGVSLETGARPITDGSSTGPCVADAVFAGIGEATPPVYRAPFGAVVEESAKSFNNTLADLTETIEANPNLRLISVVDHAAAASGRGLALPPTTELFFGNPAIGTPLMQASQSSGIDLPQKMLVWEDLLGVVRVGYNASSYLQSRHGIEGADQQLDTVAGALAGLTGVATGVPSAPVIDGATVRRDYGLVIMATERTADEAFAAIVAALEAAPPVNVVFTLEHDMNAARIGADLRPTKLVVFGNPSLGTLLMQTDRSVALDLPQKILVFTDADGQTMIAYNDPKVMANRHGLPGQQDVLRTIRGALDNFAAAGL